MHLPLTRYPQNQWSMWSTGGTFNKAVDCTPCAVAYGGMRALHLFAGAGGSVLAGRLLGWESVGAVEIDPYCCAVLEQHGEHILARDVTTFDAHHLAGKVDVVVGGWPCQDLSVAGKRAGLEGERSGLFWQMMRVVDECQPKFVFGENVTGLLSSNGGLDFAAVLGALAARGYDARWQVLGARDVGAPHKRERIWILGHAARVTKREQADKTNPVTDGWETRGELGDASAFVANTARCAGGRQAGIMGAPECETWEHTGNSVCGSDGLQLGDAHVTGLEGRREISGSSQWSSWAPNMGGWREAEPGLGGTHNGLANGLEWPAARGVWPAGRGAAQHEWEAPRTIAKNTPNRNARLKVLGNGWVPQCAAAAWRLLSSDIAE